MRQGAPALADRCWRDCADARAVAQWDALAGAAAEPNPFLESWYLLPALAAHDPQNRVRLMVLEQDGQWLGLLPIKPQPRYYRWPIPVICTWDHGNQFLGVPLVRRGREAQFWRALLERLDQRPGRALFAHFPDLPLDGPLHAALLRVCAETGRTCAVVHREERAMLASPLSPESYLEQSLSGKKRKELRRQFARLAERGTVTVERRTDGEGLAQWTEDFLALEAAGWKGTAGSALACDPATARLLREALPGAAARGRLERLALRLDGRPIAMLATFTTAPGAFSFKTAFDESLARFSPGVLLQRENLNLLAREGIAWCDSCAGKDHPMIDHLWRERRAIGRVSLAIGGPLRRALFNGLLIAELGRQPTGLRP